MGGRISPLKAEIGHTLNEIKDGVKPHKAALEDPQMRIVNHALNYIRDQIQAPFEELLLFKGVLAGRQIAAQKDDGCSKNVISREFVDRNRRLFNIRKARSIISRSNKDSTETLLEVILDVEVELGPHQYSSNWIVAN